jgi:Na+-driven multidrug efflux pump
MPDHAQRADVGDPDSSASLPVDDRDGALATGRDPIEPEVDTRRRDRGRRGGTGGTIDALLSRWFSTAQLDYRAVAALLLPVIIGQAFITGFAALSPLLVAPVGVDAISAVSTVEYLNVLLLGIFLAVTTAGCVLVAQYAGRGSRDSVFRAAGGTLWAATLLATAVGGVLLVVQGPLLDALLGPIGEQAVAYGRIYLIGLALSYPAQAVVESSAAVLRGVARTMPALYLTVTVNGGFLVLATVLARGFGLGVTGLAVALVVSRYLTACLALWLLHRDPVLGSRRGWFWPFDRTIVLRVAAIGVPFVAEQVFFNGGKLLTQTFVVGMGTAQIAANVVAQSLITVSEIVPQAMCIALVPIVGQLVGAGRSADARRLIRSFMWSSTVVALAVAAAMLTCFPWLLGLYHTPAEVEGDVLAIFLITSAARLLGWWALSYLLPSGLRAAGDTVFTTTVATVTMIARVALIWVVGVYLGYGVVGVWSVMVAEWAVRSAIFAVRFRGSRWERRSLVHAE